MAQSESQTSKAVTDNKKEVETGIKPEQPEKSYFETSFSYLSDVVYNGRHDSLSTNYITPLLRYYNKSGFYITGSLSYLKNTRESRLDLFDLSAGYDFTIIDDKLTGDIYADKYFYNKVSTAIISDERGGIGTNWNYDFNLITLSLGMDMTFATKTDICSNLSLSQEFKIEGKNASSLTLTPAVSLNMSSLNYYEGYTNRRIGNLAKKKNPNLKSATSVTTISNHNGFTLMDYEIELPVAFEAKKWGISFTPQLAIPKNPIFTNTTTTYTFKNRSPRIETINSTPLTEKNLKSDFYFELEVHFKLFGGHV